MNEEAKEDKVFRVSISFDSDIADETILNVVEKVLVMAEQGAEQGFTDGIDWSVYHDNGTGW